MNSNEKIKAYIKEYCTKLKCSTCNTDSNLFKDNSIIGDQYFCLNCLEKDLDDDADFLHRVL